MTLYWFFFFFLCINALINYNSHEYFKYKSHISNLPVNWLVLYLALVLMIGLRHEVGGDWEGYLRYYNNMETLGFLEVVKLKDPAYQVLNYISHQLGGGIYSVNTACAFIVVTFLFFFCKNQKHPELALLISFPYLILVIFMGYSRQGVAISLIMGSLIYLFNGRILKFIFVSIIAVLFHSSAVIIFPLLALTIKRNRLIIYSLTMIAMVFIFQYILVDRLDAMHSAYIESEYQSQGALIRVVLCLLPSLLFLILRKRFDFNELEYRFWMIVSSLVFVSFILLLLTPFSTAIDRVALYFIPIQLAVLSSLPSVITKDFKYKIVFTTMIAIYSFAILFVWLNYASHSGAWIPYQFYPFTFL